MKYGLELEWFLQAKDSDNLIMIDKSVFPYDESGFLVEARGQPANSIRDAVFLLKAEMYSLEKLAETSGYKLILEPLGKLSKEELRKIRRQFVKGIESFENLYGYTSHANGSLLTAGLHISFTNQRIAQEKNKTSTTVNELFDFSKLFRKLDSAFADEIKIAKRRPGFYEIKADKRIEYRSLPNNVDLLKVIDVISEF
jgi:hypothetical protein